MACELTKGRSLDCRTEVGGVRAIYLCQYEDATLTEALGEVTDFEGVSTVYKYELKRGTAAFTEALTASSENGTVFYEPNVNIKLHKLTKEDRQEIKLLAQNRLIVFVELNTKLASGNNIILCLGKDNGMEVSTGTAQSGAAFGDMNGYDLTFMGMESAPYLHLADYTTTPFDNTAFNGGVAITVDNN